MKPLDRFTTAYIECALYASTDNSDDTGGYPLDENYDASDIAPETLERMAEDCKAFQADNRADLDGSDLSEERQGHNFWLNRNGHGSGFWDEFCNDSPQAKACDRLSDASKAWGAFDLYVGDNGQIHGS
jgi:hypothetical protein